MRSGGAEGPNAVNCTSCGFANDASNQQCAVCDKALQVPWKRRSGSGAVGGVVSRESPSKSRQRQVLPRACPACDFENHPSNVVCVNCEAAMPEVSLSTQNVVEDLEFGSGKPSAHLRGNTKQQRRRQRLLQAAAAERDRESTPQLKSCA